MLKSVRQFFQQIFLKVKEEDIKNYERYLNIGEKALFEQLPNFEKVHALRCANRAQRLIHGKHDVNERQVVRAALLHDIGRIAGKITVFDKVWLKLMKYLLFPLYSLMAKKGQDPRSIFRKVYIHKFHGELGSGFLKRAGTDDNVIGLVARHAQRKKKDDPIELKYLRKADRSS